MSGHVLQTRNKRCFAVGLQANRSNIHYRLLYIRDFGASQIQAGCTRNPISLSKRCKLRKLHSPDTPAPHAGPPFGCKHAKAPSQRRGIPTSCNDLSYHSVSGSIIQKQRTSHLPCIGQRFKSTHANRSLRHSDTGGHTHVNTRLGDNINKHRHKQVTVNDTSNAQTRRQKFFRSSPGLIGGLDKDRVGDTVVSSHANPFAPTIKSRIQSSAALGNVLLEYLNSKPEGIGPMKSKSEFTANLISSKRDEFPELKPGARYGAALFDQDSQITRRSDILGTRQHDTRYTIFAPREERTSHTSHTPTLPVASLSQSLMERLKRREELDQLQASIPSGNRDLGARSTISSTHLQELISYARKNGAYGPAANYTEELLESGTLLKEAPLDDLIDVCKHTHKPGLCAQILDVARSSGEPVLVRHLLSTASIFGNEGDIPGVQRFISESRMQYPEYFNQRYTAKEIYRHLMELYASKGSPAAIEEIITAMGQASMTPGISTYNALLKGYLVAGQPERVLRVTEKLRRRQVVFDTYTYNIAIQALVATGNGRGAEAMLEDVKAARGLEPDAEIYNGVLQALRKGGDEPRVEQLLSEMQNLGIDPVSVGSEVGVSHHALPIAATQTSYSTVYEPGSQIDTHIPSQQFAKKTPAPTPVDLVSGLPQSDANSPFPELLAERLKTKSGVEAAKYAEQFDRMNYLLSTRTVDKVVDHMINTHETGMCADVLRLAAKLEKRVTAQIYLTAAQACEKGEDVKGLERLMWQMRTLHKNLFNESSGGAALHCLIKLYVRQGRVSEAREQFDLIVQPRSRGYNRLVETFAASKHPREALKVLEDMEGKGVQVYPATYSMCIDACAQSFEGETAMRVLEHMTQVSKIVPTNAIYNAVMVALTHDRAGVNTLRVGHAVRQRGYDLPFDMKARYVAACIRNEAYSEAAAHAEDLLNKGILLPGVTVRSALRIFENPPRQHLGLAVLVQANNVGAQVLDDDYLYIAQCYSHRGNLNFMRRLVRHISSTRRGFRVTAPYMDVIIRTHLKRADISTVTRLLDEVKGPVTKAYHRFIEAYNSNNQPQKALELMRAMGDHGIPRTSYTYLLAFRACVASKDGDTAYALFGEMTAQNVLPPTIETYTEVLTALENGSVNNRAEMVHTEMWKRGYKVPKPIATSMLEWLGLADVEAVNPLLVDTQSCNHFMQAYARLNQPENTLRISQVMEHNRITRDGDSYRHALKACKDTKDGNAAYSLLAALDADKSLKSTRGMLENAVAALEASAGDERAIRVHARLLQMRGTPSADLIAYVDSYIKESEPSNVTKLLREISYGTFYNVFLRAYTRIGQPEVVLGLVRSMLRDGINRNPLTYRLALAACSKTRRNEKDADLAYALYEELKGRGDNGLNDSMYTAAVVAQRGSENVERYKQMCDDMVRRGIQLPAVEQKWMRAQADQRVESKAVLNRLIQLDNGLISNFKDMEEAIRIFISHGRPELCEQVLHKARQASDILVLRRVYNTTVTLLEKAGDVRALSSVVAHILDDRSKFANPSAELVASGAINVLLKMYAQRNKLNKAWELVATSGTSQTNMYNILIDTRISLGTPERTLDILREMNANSVAPNMLTYIKTMRAWSSLHNPTSAEAVMDEIIELASKNDMLPEANTHSSFSRTEAQISDSSHSPHIIGPAHDRPDSNPVSLAVTDLLSNKDKKSELRKAWKQAAYSGTPHTTMSNLLLQSAMHAGHPERAVNVLREMISGKMSADRLTYETSVHVLNRIGYPPIAEDMLREILTLASVNEIKPSPDVRDEILELLARKTDATLYVQGLQHLQNNEKFMVRRDHAEGSDLEKLSTMKPSPPERPITQTTEGYNAAVALAMRNGQELRAEQILISLQESGVSPNIHTYQLALALKKGADWWLAQIHTSGGVDAYAEILKSCQHMGLLETINVTDSRGMVSMYTQMLRDRYLGMGGGGTEVCGSKQYTSAMALYLNANQWEMALGVWDHLCDSGLEKPPNAYDLATRACGRGQLGVEALRIYNQMLSEDYMQAHGMRETHLLVVNNVMNACTQPGMWHSAVDVLDQMESRGVSPNYLTYRFAMHSFKNSGQHEKALTFYEELKRSQSLKGGKEYDAIMDALVSAREYEKALEIYDEMHRQDIFPDAHTKSLIIEAYGATGHWQEALREFDGRKDKHGKDIVHNRLHERYLSSNSSDNRAGPQRLYNSMLGAYAKNGRWREAVQLFGQMEQQGVARNTASYAHLMRAYCEADKWTDAERVVKSLVHTQLDINHKHDYFVDAGAKELVGLLQDTLEGGRWQGCGASYMYDYLRGEIFWRRDDYIEILHAYRRAGRWRQCATHVRAMPSAGFVPCEVSYNMAIAACKEAGVKALDTGFDLLDDLRRLEPVYGVRPSTVTYNTLIAACADAGDYTRAEELFAAMGAVPRDDSTYSSIIKACRVSGMAEKVEYYLQNLEQQDTYIEPYYSRAAYTSAIAVYAHAGLCAEALSINERMRRRGVPRDALTYTNLIKACVASADAEGGMETAESLLNEMRVGLIHMNIDTYFYTLTGYGRVGKFDSMLSILIAMLDKHTYKGKPSKAPSTRSDWQARTREDNDQALERAFYTALCYLPVGTSDELVLNLQHHLVSIPALGSTRNYGLFMLHLTTQAKWDRALKVFADMEKNGAARSVGSYTVAASASLLGGELEEAQHLLHLALTRQHTCIEAEDTEFLQWSTLFESITKHGDDRLASQLDVVYERMLHKSAALTECWAAVETTQTLDLHEHSRAMAKVAVKRLLYRMVNTLGTPEGQALRGNFRGFNVGLGRHSADGPVLNAHIRGYLENELQPPIQTVNNEPWLVELDHDDLDNWLLATLTAAKEEKTKSQAEHI